MEKVCGGCNEILPTEADLPTCYGGCQKVYHHHCSIAEITWRTKSKQDRKKWKCLRCQKGKEVDTGSGVLDAINRKLDKIGTVENALEVMGQRIVETLQTMNEIMKQYEELRKENKQLKELCSELKDEVKALVISNKEKERQIRTLSHRIKELEQYTRRENVEIHGVKEICNENLKQIVVEVGRKIGVTIAKEAITAVHRMPTKNSDRDKIIIAKVGRTVADEMIRARKRAVIKNRDVGLKTEDAAADRRIYVNENFSRFYKELFGKTRRQAKEKGYKYMWTVNGKILVRKEEGSHIIRIMDEADVDMKIV